MSAVNTPSGTPSSVGHVSMTLATKPSMVEYDKVRFLIMDAPKSSNLQLYLRECQRANVTDMVRVCEETYPAADVEAAGIAMHVSLQELGGKY